MAPVVLGLERAQRGLRPLHHLPQAIRHGHHVFGDRFVLPQALHVEAHVLEHVHDHGRLRLHVLDDPLALVDGRQPLFGFADRGDQAVHPFAQRPELVAVRLEVLEVGTQIQEKVKARLDRHQREYVLREQLQVIRQELGEGEGDDESILIDLSKVPAQCEKIVFPVSIHMADERGQTFGQVSNAFIRVVNQADGQELARYDLSEDASTETASGRPARS